MNKLKHLSVAIMALILTNLNTNAEPGWLFLPVEDNEEPTGGLMAPMGTMGSPSPVTSGDFITDEIADLARSLRHDPLVIYNFVKNEIRHVPYYGLKKGAQLCLTERSGNDFDQAALLAALLQASGYAPTYRYGTMAIPYSDASDNDMLNWLPATSSNGVGNLLNWTGNPGFTPVAGVFHPHRVWIEIDVDGVTRYLDPAYKHYQTTTALTDVLSDAGYDAQDLLTAAGGTSTLAGVNPQYYAEGMDLNALVGELEAITDNLLGSMNTLYPNATIEELIGGRVPVRETVTDLPSAPLFPETVTESWGHGEIPETYASKISFFTPHGMDIEIPIADLQGKRLSLTLTDATNFRAALWLDDVKLTEENSAPGSETTLRVNFIHPTPNASIINAVNQSDGGKPYKRGASYALIYGFDDEGGLMRARQRELDRLRAAGLGHESREVLTETLNVVGLQWLYQTELFQRMSAAIDPNILFFNYHRFGRMSQEEGFFIDVPLQAVVVMNRTGAFIPGNPAIFGSSFFASAMEHGVLQQTQGAESGAVSTIKMLETAIRTGGRVFYADGANYETGDHIRSKLTGYQTATLDSFTSIFNNANNFAVLPQQGDYQIDDWTGTAYMQIRNNSIGMIINGSYGGYSTNWGNISTPTTVNRNIAAPNYYTYNPPTLVNPRSIDPVDMATGAFLLDASDLRLGSGALPRGLSFQRHYNSLRNADDTPGLGYGWTHNLHGRVTIRSAVDAGLGETTPAEAAPLLLAAAVVRDLIANRQSRSAREWTIAALVTDWATDQLLDNAASVSIGDRTLQFIRMPDGSYVSPAGVSATLEHHADDTFTLTERFGNTYHFAGAGDDHHLVKVTGPFGLEANFTYHTDGRLQQVEDAYGRILTLSYTDDRITSVSDSTGRSLAFGFDTHGNLTTAIDPEGKTTTYHYHDANTGPAFAGKRLMVAINLPDNRVPIRNFYDSQNRVIEQHGDDDPDRLYQLYFNGRENIEEDPLGGRDSYFFSEKFRNLGTADALGNRTTKAYDGQDNLIAQTTPGQAEVTTEFDAHQNPILQNLPGNLEQTHTYDSLHRLTETRVKDLTGTHPDRVTTATYLSGNNTRLPDSVTDPEGNVTEYTYHPDGQIHTETAVSSTGNRTTTFQYGPRGLPILITYPDSTTESFVYNDRGDLLSETDRRGHTTTYQYNDRRELTHITAPDGGVTVRTFDDNGNLETVTDPEGNVTRKTWSPQKKLLTVTTAYGTAEAATTTHEYDERDWRVRTIDPLGRTTHYEYDAAQRLIKLGDPLGRETHFTYDADGNRTSITTPEGIFTQHGYNERGEQIAMTDPAANTVTHTHNAFGEQTELENRRGHSHTFTYNKNGQLRTLATPLGHTTTTNYNDLGEATTIVKPTGQTTSFTHDNMGRIVTQTDDVGTISINYDNADNPLTITEGTAVLTRTFDNMGRVQTYTDAAGNTVEYEWDKNGRLTEITYPDNKTVTYTYDAHNRLKTVTDWANRVTTYYWDAAGRLIGIDRPNGTTRTNEYTLGDELERYFERGPDGILQAYARFGYDLDSRIDWRYRLPKPQEMNLPSFTATHDADNRVATWNSQSVTHDNDGNMTFGPLPGEEDFVNYNFDARNRLTSVGDVTYQYDSENNRIVKTTADGTTTYVFDPHGDALPRVLVRERPDESLTFYVYGIGLLYEVDEAENATYYHFDQSGSTIALTNDAGEITDRIEYTPYGTISHLTGETDTPFLYAGQFGIQADSNGLLHMRARYYSPELKRFINADPAGFDGGLNWYAYANNSPLMYVDPDGETPVTIMIGMVVGGVAGGLMSAFDGDPHTTFMGGFISGAITGGLTGSGVGLIGRAAFTTIRGASTAGFFGLGGGVIGNTSGQGWNNWRAGYSFNQNMARISARSQVTAGVSNAFSTVTFGAASAGLSHYSNRLIDAGLNRGSNYVSGLASTGMLGRNQLNAVSNNLMNPLLRIESATRSITGGGGLRNDFTSSLFSTGYGITVNRSFSSGATAGGGFKY